MDFEQKIIDWISKDSARMDALSLASTLKLNDWCIAAGFVRNLVWDAMHKKLDQTPLNDIDLIYFDPSDTNEESEERYEAVLKQASAFPWSVKNQARMHLKNGDIPYVSTTDAMSYWVEVETAVGVRLSNSSSIEILAPFGVSSLFNSTITFNKKRDSLNDFYNRIEKKQWLSLWPKLTVSA